MSGATDFLMGVRRLAKLDEQMRKDICRRYELSLMEVNVIGFLHNNPELDTAGDITELRSFSKSNVSQAVERLIRKSYLSRWPDGQDRRRIHLRLLPAAAPVTAALDEARERFQGEILAGLTAEELTQLETLKQKIIHNTENAMKRRETL